MRPTARLLPSLLAVVALLSACSQSSGPAPSPKTGSAAPALTADGVVFGNPGAKVNVIEYASASCSHCARFDADVFPAFKAKYVDTGLVRYEFREFLTAPEQYAVAAFALARCAGADKYMSVVEAAFRGQKEMFATQDMRGPLLKVAQAAGMTEPQFNACVSDPAAMKAIQDRVQRAETQAHVNSTPSVFVNGQPLAVGEPTLADLDGAIQPLLARQ